MEALIGGGAAAAGDANLIKNSSTATFRADVIDASHDAAGVVDFWAPRCGPCKQLGAALGKAVRGSRGKGRLGKIDIDPNPQIAQQMRIQSIPPVYPLKGRPPGGGFLGAPPRGP